MGEYHHPNSPSKLKLQELCSCFEGSDEESLASIEGSMLHDKCYRQTTEGLNEEQELLRRVKPKACTGESWV